jgi:hypothetical protein
MVDTGAPMSAVDEKVIAALAVTPAGETEVHAAIGSGQARRYDVSLILPGSGGQSMLLNAMPILEGKFILGIDGFLGRDVLSHCVLVYDGPASRFTLAF